MGRNRSVAAWAFALAMVLGCGNAVALELGTPSTALAQPVAVPSVPSLPALDILPPVQAPTVPPPAAPAQPSQPPPASPAAGAPRAPQAARVPIREQVTGRYAAAGLTPARPASAAASGTGPSRPTSARKGERTRARATRARREPAATLEKSPFGRLGELPEGPSPVPLLTEFADGSPASGMSWAVPLLAIMLPIGLCGFLQARRRPC
jgi:hypothetical protein